MSGFDNDPTPVDDSIIPVDDPTPVDPTPETPVVNPMAPSRGGSLEFSVYDGDTEEVEVSDDDETAVAFRPVSQLAPDDLFADLPEVDTAPPPPLLIPPRPVVAERRLSSGAPGRAGQRRTDPLLIVIAFLGGIIAASLVYIGITYLRSCSVSVQESPAGTVLIEQAPDENPGR